MDGTTFTGEITFIGEIVFAGETFRDTAPLFFFAGETFRDAAPLFFFEGNFSAGWGFFEIGGIYGGSLLGGNFDGGINEIPIPAIFLFNGKYFFNF